MREPIFDKDTQSFHTPLDTLQDIARDIMLAFARDREGKLRKMIGDAIEKAALAELGEYHEDLSTQQMKLIASETARRAIASLAAPVI